jgi:hypothetical protein
LGGDFGFAESGCKERVKKTKIVGSVTRRKRLKNFISITFYLIHGVYSIILSHFCQDIFAYVWQNLF